VKNPAQLPQKDWKDGSYASVWQDGELMRHIRSKSIKETWTQYDPELVERDFLPKERRKELMAVKVNRLPQAVAAARTQAAPQAAAIASPASTAVNP
jgi:hypothetical protein